jgi:predicted small metal-binding protein
MARARHASTTSPVTAWLSVEPTTTLCAMATRDLDEGVAILQSAEGTLGGEHAIVGGGTVKILRCGELISECEEVIEGIDLDEVLSQALEHMLGAHGIAEVSGHVEARLWAAIRTR